MGLQGLPGMKGDAGLEGLRVSWKETFDFSNASLFFTEINLIYV